MLIDICIKFREYSLSGFQVIERTQCDRQTDAWGKTICLPTLKGGDIILYIHVSSHFHTSLYYKHVNDMPEMLMK